MPRFRMDGRRRIGVIMCAAGVVLLLVAGVLFAGRDSGEATPGFAAAPKVSGKYLSTAFSPAVRLPTDCDDVISRGTATKLVPGAEPGMKQDKETTPNYLTCVWSEDPGGKQRSLQVRISRSESTPQAMTSFMRTRDQIYGFYRDNRKDKKSEYLEPKPLSGVGDEALFYGQKEITSSGYGVGWSSSVGTLVRVRNMSMQIEYSANAGYGGGQDVPPLDSLRPRAFDAAVNAARNMGSTATSEPKITTPPPGPSTIKKLPSPCDLVTKATLAKLGGPAPAAPVHNNWDPIPDEKALQSDTKRASCGWNQDGGRSGFKVETILTPDEIPGIGADIAKRQYLGRFPASRNDKTFSALRGPGDEAFVIRREPGACPTRPKNMGCAELNFRVRNVLASIWYAGAAADGKPLTYDQMTRRAYAIAIDAANSMSR